MVKTESKKKQVVGLFVTCLVDLFRPSVGFASVKLIEDAGFEVVVPEAQTCCGQPAYNSGANDHTRAIAKQVIEAFEDFDHVVAPSGSCAAMLKHHYPTLFEGDPAMAKRAQALADRTWELVSFLTDIAGVKSLNHSVPEHITYHDSCAGLRELGVAEQPRQLLASIKGLTLTEMEHSDVCCGFGGTFCVKFGDISNEMVANKTADIAQTKADMILAGDLGCLMNIAGKLKRDNVDIKVRHVAEVLAGFTDTPAIAAPANDDSNS